jgi:hypothetical protein
VLLEHSHQDGECDVIHEKEHFSGLYEGKNLLGDLDVDGRIILK